LSSAICQRMAEKIIVRICQRIVRPFHRDKILPRLVDFTIGANCCLLYVSRQWVIVHLDIQIFVSRCSAVQGETRCQESAVPPSKSTLKASSFSDFLVIDF
jgi:hypothetical protein